MKAFTLCVLVLVLAASWAKPVKRKSKMFNPNLFEGDIKILGWNKWNKDRNAVPLDSQRWPGGVIPYQVEMGYSPKMLKLLREAFNYLSKETCLQFVKRTTERDYVRVFEGDGCYSMWGRLGGEQELSLEADGCDEIGTVIHELLHAVGFGHEHSRYDRDDYIIIHWDNIEEDNFDQFEKRRKNAERRFTRFDYDSIMLYGPSSFAIDKDFPTIEAIDGRELLTNEERSYPSESDIERINILYECY